MKMRDRHQDRKLVDTRETRFANYDFTKSRTENREERRQHLTGARKRLNRNTLLNAAMSASVVGAHFAADANVMTTGDAFKYTLAAGVVTAVDRLRTTSQIDDMGRVKRMGNAMLSTFNRMWFGTGAFLIADSLPVESHVDKQALLIGGILALQGAGLDLIQYATDDSTLRNKESAYISNYGERPSVAPQTAPLDPATAG